MASALRIDLALISRHASRRAWRPLMVLCAGLGTSFVARAQNAAPVLPRFELRLVADPANSSESFKLALKQKLPLEHGLPVAGDLNQPQITVSAARWGFSSKGLYVSGLSLDLVSPKWTYEQGPFLQITCDNVRAHWDLGTLSLSTADLFKLDFELRSTGEGDNQRVSGIGLSGPLREILTSLLKPLFSENNITRNLQLEAQCPAQMSQVLQGILRAWLVDWPTEKPSDFGVFVSALETQLKALDLGRFAGSNDSNTIELPRGLRYLSQLPISYFRDPADPSRLISLKASASTDPRVLRLYFAFSAGNYGVEESLSSRARELLVNGAPSDGGMELVLSNSMIQMLLEVALKNLPVSASSGASTISKDPTNGALELSFSSPLRLEDFTSILPELTPYKESFPSMRLRLVFENCQGVASVPRLRPFVTQSGLNALDVEWGASVEFMDPAFSQVLAKRHLKEFVLTAELIRGLDGKLSPVFVGGKIMDASLQSDAGANEVCSIPKFPIEFVLTLDWLFQSERLSGFVNQGLLSQLKLPGSEKLRFRQVGQATLSTQRGSDRPLGGGFYSEALIIGVPSH